jgi:hypothetical protein
MLPAFDAGILELLLGVVAQIHAGIRSVREVGESDGVGTAALG